MNDVRAFQLCFGVLGSIIGYSLGGIDDFLICLTIFVVLDYLTGVILAIIYRELSSEIGFRGILKKISIFIIIALATILDYKIIKLNGALRMGTIFFYISNEGISILENLADIGVPIPKKIVNVLKQVNTDNKDEGEEEDIPDEIDEEEIE